MPPALDLPHLQDPCPTGLCPPIPRPGEGAARSGLFQTELQAPERERSDQELLSSEQQAATAPPTGRRRIPLSGAAHELRPRPRQATDSLVSPAGVPDGRTERRDPRLFHHFKN